MIRSQAVDVQPWKIHAWYTQLNTLLEAFEANLQDVEDGEMPSSQLFPKLSKHWEELVPTKDGEAGDDNDEEDPGSFQVLLEWWRI
jgi:hypothetical protein